MNKTTHTANDKFKAERFSTNSPQIKQEKKELLNRKLDNITLQSKKLENLRLRNLNTKHKNHKIYHLRLRSFYLR